VSSLVRRVLRCEPDTGLYRYLLDVRLTDDPAARRLAVVLKNPSTASAVRSDPTVGKVETWARRQSIGAVSYVNLFALRATRPTALNAHPYAATVGAENDEYILGAATQADVVVVAWGNPNGIAPERYRRRIGEVLALLGGQRLHVVGPLTRLGYPRHGLLWNDGAALAPWCRADATGYDCQCSL
jgi:hypothetical protein